MDNQKGEVVIGLMVVMMAAMMLLSGTRFRHEGHCSGEDHLQHTRAEVRYHDDGGTRAVHENAGEHAAEAMQEEGK